MRVHDDQLPRLRAWMAQLQDRIDEVRETFANEGVREEQVQLLETSDGPLLVYAVEADDIAAALEAYRTSTLPIDLEHREIMSAVVAEELSSEFLLHLAAE